VMIRALIVETRNLHPADILDDLDVIEGCLL